MKRFTYKDKEDMKQLMSDSQFAFQDVNDVVQGIIDDIRTGGTTALKRFTKEFDRVDMDVFSVSNAEIDQAMSELPDNLISDLTQAYNNILRYHEKQLPSDYEISENGSVVGQLIRPIERVGMYVPGGTAAYPSTVLMNAAPAKIAGVKQLVMVTPPNKDGSIDAVLLAAARIAGVDQVYKVGGAQAIAALALGTTVIPQVDKIVGPGNIYVAVAKKILSGIVGIDMIAGPSEVVVIADGDANPRFVAADLLAQAEHDELAKVVLITTSDTLADNVEKELRIQTAVLERKKIIEKSLENHGYIVLVDTLEEAVALSNQIAPEHLELQCNDAKDYVNLISNAGAIFVGAFTPEPVGDYFAGPNHTLPTSGTARFSSALSTTDFIKKISLISYSKSSLDNAKDAIIRIANEEGLTAHANAIKVRYEND